MGIHASYFVPDELMMKAIGIGTGRVVKILVLVPGKHIDSDTVRIASKRLWCPLLENGAEIFEYGQTMMHVKSLTGDGCMATVGSTNSDVRSFQLNDEVSMDVYDWEFATGMAKTFEEDLRHAKKYDHAIYKPPVSIGADVP